MICEIIQNYAQNYKRCKMKELLNAKSFRIMNKFIKRCKINEKAKYIYVKYFF
jgi:hypothetical protein